MTTSLVAIDPGKNACAVAFFKDGRLDILFNLKAGEVPSTGAQTAIWEKPQGDGRGVPVDDLIAVTAAGADLARTLVGRLGTVRAVTPREWKASTPKPLHHDRMQYALHESEYALHESEQELIGGADTWYAIKEACKRGAADNWSKDGKTYYRARDFPTVNGLKITHDILDAVALGLFGLGRLGRGGAASDTRKVTGAVLRHFGSSRKARTK